MTLHHSADFWVQCWLVGTFDQAAGAIYTMVNLEYKPDIALINTLLALFISMGFEEVNCMWMNRYPNPKPYTLISKLSTLNYRHCADEYSSCALCMHWVWWGGLLVNLCYLEGSVEAGSNERAYSVESSLQSFSSNSFLKDSNQLFGSNPNVILTAQTCGSAEVWLRKANTELPLHFSVRFCYMFLTSKCRGEWEVGVCMTAGLAKTMPRHSGEFRRILRPNTFKNRQSALHIDIVFASHEHMHRPRSDSPLHFDTRNL